MSANRQIGLQSVLGYLVDSVDIQRLELGLGLGLWYLVLVRGHSVPQDTSILQPPPQNEPARAWEMRIRAGEDHLNLSSTGRNTKNMRDFHF